MSDPRSGGGGMDSGTTQPWSIYVWSSPYHTPDIYEVILRDYGKDVRPHSSLSDLLSRDV